MGIVAFDHVLWYGIAYSVMRRNFRGWRNWTVNDIHLYFWLVWKDIGFCIFQESGGYDTVMSSMYGNLVLD